MIKALFLAVADGAIGEQRSIALTARLQQGFLARDVEKGLLPASKTRLGEVFGGGTTANGDIGFGHLIALAQLAVGLADRLGNRLWEVRTLKQPAQRSPDLVQRFVAALQVIGEAAVSS